MPIAAAARNEFQIFDQAIWLFVWLLLSFIVYLPLIAPPRTTFFFVLHPNFVSLSYSLTLFQNLFS